VPWRSTRSRKARACCSHTDVEITAFLRRKAYQERRSSLLKSLHVIIDCQNSERTKIEAHQRGKKPVSF
jgi:hypothetical protein